MSDAGEAQHLLPIKATPLEVALSLAVRPSAESAPEPALHPLLDPWQVPRALLPWLAWERDVPVWPLQCERMQRHITARAWELHRRRGTPACYRELARFVGSRVRRFVRPPARLFAGAALSVEERNRFLSRYPQLRLYPYRNRGTRVGAMLRGLYAGACHPVISDARTRIGLRPFLWDAGTEMPLRQFDRDWNQSEREAVIEVPVRGKAGACAFAVGHPRFPVKRSAARRLYRLRLAQTYTHGVETVRMTETVPSLQPISSRYEMVAARGTARGVYRFLGCLAPSTAHERLYRRVYLFDPARAVEGRGRGPFVGAARFGMAPYTAEIEVEVRDRRSRRQVSRYLVGHLVRSAQRRYRQMFAALRFARSARDRVWINTTTTRPVGAGQRVAAGAYLAGGWTAD